MRESWRTSIESIERYYDSLLGCRYSAVGGVESAFGARRADRSTMGQAEQEAMSPQAFLAGDPAAAFQAAHVRSAAAGPR